MRTTRHILILLAALIAGSPGLSRPAFGALPVIDATAIAQLVTQLKTLEQQLLTARNQLLQAQTEFASITGTRGMQTLLSTIERNYLPEDWAAIQSLLGGAAGYGGLGAAVQAAVTANTFLSPELLAALPPDARKEISGSRQNVALLQAMSQQALGRTSGQFSSIQTLIDTIGGAPDQKAILELQARIAAEGGMLQNEQTKLQVLRQTVDALRQSDQQQVRELVIAAHGQFATRLQPTPP